VGEQGLQLMKGLNKDRPLAALALHKFVTLACLPSIESY